MIQSDSSWQPPVSGRGRFEPSMFGIGFGMCSQAELQARDERTSQE